jgi:hypothetical protein
LDIGDFVKSEVVYAERDLALIYLLVYVVYVIMRMIDETNMICHLWDHGLLNAHWVV